MKIEMLSSIKKIEDRLEDNKESNDYHHKYCFIIVTISIS